MKVIEYSKEALRFIPDAKKKIPMGHMEEQLLIVLADAAEGQGDMPRAYKYDKEALELYVESGLTKRSDFLFMNCFRREGIELLAAGNPNEAVLALMNVTSWYHHTWIW